MTHPDRLPRRGDRIGPFTVTSRRLLPYQSPFALSPGYRVCLAHDDGRKAVAIALGSRADPKHGRRFVWTQLHRTAAGLADHHTGHPSLS